MSLGCKRYGYFVVSCLSYSDLRRDRLVVSISPIHSRHFAASAILPLLFLFNMVGPVTICRGSISFVLIVAQLSLAYDALNVEPIQTSGGPSSPLPAFPGSDDGGFTGILGLSTPEDPMVDGSQFKQSQDLSNNEGNFELASGEKDCTPGASRRGKRRARRSDPSFCPLNLKVSQIPIRKL